MATIDISRPHNFDKQTAKAKAEALAKGMQEKLGIEWRWAGDEIVFNAPSGMAKGTNGKVVVLDKEVQVAVDLPFMLRAMKGKISDKITEKLGEVLA
ncbi:MAG: polyhydroxyalkanoic acid system family protein [Nannocystis sp.]|jgi:putative polyhydroxyalkanoate system protein|nr:polyhydroxyalkanoic acid system family protein [Nannocystis sp.]